MENMLFVAFFASVFTLVVTKCFSVTLSFALSYIVYILKVFFNKQIPTLFRCRAGFFRKLLAAPLLILYGVIIGPIILYRFKGSSVGLEIPVNEKGLSDRKRVLLGDFSYHDMMLFRFCRYIVMPPLKFWARVLGKDIEEWFFDIRVGSSEFYQDIQYEETHSTKYTEVKIVDPYDSFRIASKGKNHNIPKYNCISITAGGK